MDIALSRQKLQIGTPAVADKRFDKLTAIEIYAGLVVKPSDFAIILASLWIKKRYVTFLLWKKRIRIFLSSINDLHATSNNQLIKLKLDNSKSLSSLIYQGL
ncbi:MAG: hypothetical protein ACP5PZ_11260 [Bacteroidales bacterium]